MGENSEISWTHHTFNPWMGCSKVSEGCRNCYAETLMDTRYGKVKWGPNGTRVKTLATNWRKPFAWDRAAAKVGERHRVFCASLADVFEDRDELIPWRTDLIHIINQTPNLDWLILTKRPENVLRMAFEQQLWWPDNGIPQNIWMGTSVENQEAADVRIPELAKIPAVVRFLSMEPLLGPVDISKWLGGPIGQNANGFWGVQRPIHWVIVGGESGHDARPMHPEWVESIRDQCTDHGDVPFHFKQWGEWHNGSHDRAEPFTVLNDGDHFPMMTQEQIWNVLHVRKWTERDWHDRSPTVMCRTGKKIAGRTLDGREWDEFPYVSHVTGG